MKIGCLEVPKASYPPYFDQLSESSQPLWLELQTLVAPTDFCSLLFLGSETCAQRFNGPFDINGQRIFVGLFLTIQVTFLAVSLKEMMGTFGNS